LGVGCPQTRVGRWYPRRSRGCPQTRVGREKCAPSAPKPVFGGTLQRPVSLPPNHRVPKPSCQYGIIIMDFTVCVTPVLAYKTCVGARARHLTETGWLPARGESKPPHCAHAQDLDRALVPQIHPIQVVTAKHSSGEVVTVCLFSKSASRRGCGRRRRRRQAPRLRRQHARQQSPGCVSIITSPACVSIGSPPRPERVGAPLQSAYGPPRPERMLSAPSRAHMIRPVLLSAQVRPVQSASVHSQS
jgi:hypothetical protein